MKATTSICLALSIFLACSQHGDMEKITFKSERVSQSASFLVDADIETVFPLFGAFEERKWEPNWNPILIYPDTEMIEEGTTFKISGHGHGNETELLWIVSKFDPQSYIIQYLVSTENRFWTITVQCETTTNIEKTHATVTYNYTGLNDLGNKLNKKSLKNMYKNNLQNWAEAINNYLPNIAN